MSTLDEKLTRLTKLRELEAKVAADIAACEADIRDQIKSVEAQLKGKSKRRPRTHTPECGTESAFQRHHHNSEPVDEACKAAHAAHERARVAS